jgi:hypothetical protein
MAAIGCGISYKTNAETTEQKQQRNNTTKPQIYTFSKYCKNNRKKFETRYTQIIQGP